MGSGVLATVIQAGARGVLLMVTSVLVPHDLTLLVRRGDSVIALLLPGVTVIRQEEAGNGEQPIGNGAGCGSLDRQNGALSSGDELSNVSFVSASETWAPWATWAPRSARTRR